MFVVGVTGGIGSGKTAVTNTFAELGITVVDADIASRVVVEPGQPALAAIADHFGPELLQPDGTLDRAAMRKLVFTNPEAKQWLEQCLHPLIRQEVARQISTAPGPYVVFVSPLLIEADQRGFCDRILVVDAPETLQLQRTVARDDNDVEQVRRIIGSQASRAQRLKVADDIIENDGSLELLRSQVRQLHQRYLAMAAAIREGGPAMAPIVKCPGCGTAVAWTTENPSRPFCSERCRNEDFVGWANETHSIPGDETFDDLLSGDLPPRQQ